jgi:hypothetical protein
MIELNMAFTVWGLTWLPPIVLCILTISQSREGFLGVNWGAQFVSLKERFALAPTADTTTQEQYSSNIREVGGAEISEVDFEFTKGRFSGVIVFTVGRSNSHKLLSYIQSLFGNGNEIDSLTYQWVRGSTHVSYDEDSEGDSYVYWYCLDYQKPRPSPPRRLSR